MHTVKIMVIRVGLMVLYWIFAVSTSEAIFFSSDGLTICHYGMGWGYRVGRDRYLFRT